MSVTRRPLSALGGAALLASLLLAGCSQGEEAPGTTTTTAPEDEQSVTTQDAASDTATEEPEETDPAADSASETATGPDSESQTAGPFTLAAADDSFTVEVPDGWEDVITLVDSDDMLQAVRDDILVALKQRERIDDFFSTLMIVKHDYVSDLTQAVEQTAERLAGDEWEYEILDPAPVDGNRAPGFTIIREQEGVLVHQTQRWVSHQGTLHLVNLSVVESQAEEGQEMLDAVLDSWRWND